VSKSARSKKSSLSHYSHSRPFAGLLVFLLFSFFFATSLHSKPKSTPEVVAPSIGHDIATIVVRGGTCELDLRGIVMPGDKVEFKIKNGPSHGTLEGPQRIDRETVSYIYRHNGKKGAQADRMDFKLKTGPNNAWGSVSARISIVEPSSSLAIEGDFLDFGAVPIGERASLPLKIRNAGGGILRGKVEVVAPWSVTESPEFELGGGESRQFIVDFSPVDDGEVKGRIEFQSGSGPYRSVTLSGEGVYRFQVPEQISLVKKTGAEFLEISNLESSDLNLDLSAPPPLLSESKITIPARGTVKLKLCVQDEIYTQTSVNLTIADGSAIRSVRVDLPPSPVRLEWQDAPVFNAGRFPLRNVPELQIGLANAGATKAIVRLVPGEAGLRLAPSQAESFEIGEGEKAIVNVLWNLPEKTGEARAKLSALQGEFAAELELIAEVAPPDEKPAPAVNTKKSDPDPSSSPGKKRANVLSEAEKKELQLRMPAGISYHLVPEAGAATAIVRWNYQGPKPAKFQLERKIVTRQGIDSSKVFEKRLEVPEQLPSSPVVVRWAPVDDSIASIECLDGMVWQGRVPGLESGYNHLRIVSTSPDGKRIDYADFVVEAGTPPRSPWMNWAMAGMMLIALYLLRWRIARWLGLASDS
jgi:hypothetical protein